MERLKTGGWRRHGIVRALDLGRLMGVPNAVLKDMSTPRIVLDDAELQQLHEAGIGFVYNDYSALGKTGFKYNVLHAAPCGWVRKSNTNVPKFFFEDFDDAYAWLEMSRGLEGENWKRCGTCHAEIASKPPPSRKPAQTISSPATNTLAAEIAPFTEGRVEKVLEPWLKSQGFVVQMRVRVPNGIIDLVAKKPEEEWIIEAKGEDRGGFNSAEMNFRIGISQICSRMSEAPGRVFALAIPMTPHFRRVLVKHRSFSVFERMRVWLLVVEDGNKVRAVSPGAVQGYVDELALQ